jgi:hypothetical protein
MARIVVGSYAIRFPVGGYFSWVLQWLFGFHRLGHEVYCVEKSGYRDSCFNPVTRLSTDDCSYGIQTFRDFLARFELGDRWCYVDAGGKYHGLSKTDIEQVFESADVFLDMGSHGAWLDETSKTALTVWVDGEPAFRQFKLSAILEAGGMLPKYDYYYTVGRNIGTDRNWIPTLGLEWRPIFDPVVVDLFPRWPAQAGAPFTTVMSWSAHKPVEFNGTIYGQKDGEFMKFLDLPAIARAPLEIAVSGQGVPTERLMKAGWRVRDSVSATLSFDKWREYIGRSRGEFSVCKNVFVATDSGFFSDRSAVYLASGRPVVMQDTGFSAHLPCGKGLFAVRSVEEAAAAIEEIESDYELHSNCAREIAMEYLDAPRVLGRLLKELGL